MINSVHDAIRATKIAIKQLPGKESSKYPGNYEHDLSYLNMVLSALQEKLDREKQPDGWRLIRDGKLPDEFEKVIVNIENRYSDIGYWKRAMACGNENNRCWKCTEFGTVDFYSVVGWLPLPPVEKGEQA